MVPDGVIMSVSALSIAGFTQYVAASSNISASQQALQSLQQSLAAGDLSGAQSAFNSYQSLNQNLVNAGGSGSSSSQLATDLTALGSAISSGDLATSQSAFLTVQNDLKGTTSPAIAAALTAVSQTVTEIEDLLSIFDTSGSSTPASTDPFTEILNTAYGQNASPTATASATDPTTALLESKYGTQLNASAPGAATNDSQTSGTGVNTYA